MPRSADIVFERTGRLGVITLHRPQALNALTWGMTRRMRALAERVAQASIEAPEV